MLESPLNAIHIRNVLSPSTTSRSFQTQNPRNSIRASSIHSATSSSATSTSDPSLNSNSVPPSSIEFVGSVLEIYEVESDSLYKITHPPALNHTFNAISDHLDSIYREKPFTIRISTADAKDGTTLTKLVTVHVNSRFSPSLHELPVPIAQLTFLPVNAVIFECQDGTLYVTSETFSILVANKIITPPPVPPSPSSKASPTPPPPPLRSTSSKNNGSASPLRRPALPSPQTTSPKQSSSIKKPVSPNNSASPVTSPSSRSAKIQEYINLKATLEKESLLLKKDRQVESFEKKTLTLSTVKLNNLVEQAKSVSISNDDIASASVVQNEKLTELEFLVECRQIKLLSQLHSIYPIKRVSEEVYAIRDLEIPRDLSSSTDEDVSSALGYLCHLVFMVSKYLSVPLRYKITCNASRSTITDVSDVYPLFKARNVAFQRERFERGVWMLERDVECVLAVRGIQVPPRMVHVLAKVEYLFMVVVCPQKLLKREE